MMFPQGRTLFLWGVLLTGGVFSKDALPQKTKIAFLFSGSGSDSLLEKELGRGVEVFKKNRSGNSSSLQITPFNIHGSIQGTLAELSKVKEQDYRFVIGLRNDEQALTASHFAEENGLLFVTPVSVFSKVTQGKKNSFSISADEILYGAALAKYAVEELDRKKILVLLNQRSVFSQSFSESFQKGLKRYKGIELAEHRSSGRELNLESLKVQISRFKPDLVFISDDISNSAILAKYIHRIDPMIPFLAGAPFGSESAMRILLKEVPKMRVFYSALWNDAESNVQNETFKNTYLELFPGGTPSAEAALTYDALCVLVQAIQTAGGGNSIDRVRYFLEKLKFTTTQGEINFHDGPTHAPIRPVHIKVSNVKKNKWVKTLRTKWNLKP
ncbi:MAG: ABC transporter substrate-binding protein [Deltaproteobacteria bacterium]